MSKMCAMKRVLVTISILAVAVGCRPVRTETQTGLQSSESRQIELLREETQTLETEKAVVEEKYCEAKNRAERLQKKINDLEFTVDQHKDTIAILARAPIERDKLKKQVKAMEEENALLKKELEALKKKLAARR